MKNLMGKGARTAALALCCLWAALVPARATTTVTEIAAPHLDGTASGASARHGALYRVTRADTISYLYGTVHVGTPAFAGLAPEVRQALSHAGKLVLELDTRAKVPYEEALRKHARYADGDSIGAHIAPDTLAQLRSALHGHGISLASVAGYKPWLLANLLTGLELERSGYSRRHGIEATLLASAGHSGTPIAELESADYQLALYDTLGDQDGERYLREVLADLADGNSLRKARAIMDAWYAADAAGLDAVLHSVTSGDSVESSFTRRTLLGKRNPEMAAHIERLMGETKVTFVGVGLLHLLGEQGLPRLLKQRGYQVERIY